MNDRELLTLVAATDRYPVARPLPDGWEPDLDEYTAPVAVRPEAPAPTVRVRPPAVVRRRSTRRWRPLAAAAVLLLVVAVAAGLRTTAPPVGQDTIAPPTTTVPPVPITAVDAPTTTVAADPRLERARDIAEAYYSLDEQTLVDAIGDPAVAASAVFRNQRDAAALHTRVAPGAAIECEQAPANLIRCGVLTTSDLRDAFPALPESPDVISVSFRDEGVIGVTITVGGEVVIRDLLEWVAEHEPNRTLENCSDTTTDERAACWQAIFEVVPAYMADR